MFVGVVGSRRLGGCPERHGLSFPPTPEELAHSKICPRLMAMALMRKVVARAASLPEFEGVVSGGASGADSLAREACGTTIPFKEILPAPGPAPFWQRAKERNQRIVDKVGMLIAIYASGPLSPGTSDTVARARAKGIPVHVFHDGRWS